MENIISLTEKDVLQNNQYINTKIDILYLKNIKNVFSKVFKNCLIDKLIVDSAEDISWINFRGNKIKELIFTGRNRIITADSFARTDLEKLKLSENIEIISSSAFYNNKLTKLTLPPNIKEIQSYAFKDNNIEKIILPDSIETIGTNAFDEIEIQYKDMIFNKELIAKIGTENIITYYNVCKNNIVDKSKVSTLSKEALYLLPLDKEIMKGYCANYKQYDKLLNEILQENNLINFKDMHKLVLFKACYILGFFSNPNKETIDFIKKIINDFTLEGFITFFEFYIEQNSLIYKPDFKDFFIKMYKEGNVNPNRYSIYQMIYKNFSEFKKQSNKRREIELRNISREILINHDNPELQAKLKEKYNEKKKKLKELTYEDITNILTKYTIKPENERIREILSFVPHYKQKDITELENIYELGRNNPKSIPIIEDSYIGSNSFKYKWSKEDEPINLVIGIICLCCARLEEKGKDIMIQSVINPNIVNLILYDENNYIVGKSTAYINKDKKYILFNNIETKELGTKGLKSAKQRKIECLQSFLRAVNDLVKKMKEENIDISQVSVGMGVNDLKETIIEYGLEVVYSDLLENFSYNGYPGDANNPEHGQAILYKDEENNNLNLK